MAKYMAPAMVIEISTMALLDLDFNKRITNRTMNEIREPSIQIAFGKAVIRPETKTIELLNNAP